MSKYKVGDTVMLRGLPVLLRHRKESNFSDVYISRGKYEALSGVALGQVIVEKVVMRAKREGYVVPQQHRHQYRIKPIVRLKEANDYVQFLLISEASMTLIKPGGDDGN